MSGMAILAVLFAFQVKHFLADFCWQSAWMIAGKRDYGRGGGIAHAGLHAVLSVPILLVAGSGAALALLLAACEAIVHFHIDWLKAGATARRHLTPKDRAYWCLSGLDQLAHQCTYLAMIAVLLDRMAS
ncbi:DUF3307 domain-containing protein [Tropicimonas sp.]|uniref:DUF3307 domain-containing protein n=1 Tax=Tropicimonas sp. TaxID=2067044 RepID=UPI003A892B54